MRDPTVSLHAWLAVITSLVALLATLFFAGHSAMDLDTSPGGVFVLVLACLVSIAVVSSGIVHHSAGSWDEPTSTRDGRSDPRRPSRAPTAIPK